MHIFCFNKKFIEHIINNNFGESAPNVYYALKDVNENTVLIPDPAFALDHVDCPLPKGWIEGKMIGINASPLIFENASNEKLVFDAYIELIRYILQKTDFLYPVTLSETGYIVKSYLGLDYAYDMEEKEIHLYADNFVPGQAFYVRTKGEIQKAEGAGFEKVSDGYYMVRLKSPEAVLVLV